MRTTASAIGSLPTRCAASVPLLPCAGREAVKEYISGECSNRSALRTNEDPMLRPVPWRSTALKSDMVFAIRGRDRSQLQHQFSRMLSPGARQAKSETKPVGLPETLGAGQFARCFHNAIRRPVRWRAVHLGQEADGNIRQVKQKDQTCRRQQVRAKGHSQLAYVWSSRRNTRCTTGPVFQNTRGQ